MYSDEKNKQKINATVLMKFNKKTFLSNHFPQLQMINIFIKERMKKKIQQTKSITCVNTLDTINCDS